MITPKVEYSEENGTFVTKVTYGDSSVTFVTNDEGPVKLNDKIKMGLDTALRAALGPKPTITPENFLSGIRALSEVSAKFAELYMNQAEVALEAIDPTSISYPTGSDKADDSAAD